MGTMEDTNSRRVRRLGRGLSGLLNDAAAPVEVSVHKPTETTASEPEARSAGVVLIPVAQIEPSRFQPRRVFDQVALERLADSIRRSGVMQPVIVRPVEKGLYELVAGERRWRAAAEARLTEIPALVRELSDEESAEWGLVENVQREDLNPMERAWAFRSLVERFGLQHGQIAERVGMDRSSVANTIRLTELEEPIRNMIGSGRLTAGHGKALLACPPGPTRIALAEQACDEGWTVRRTERAATIAAAGGDATAAPSPIARAAPDVARVAARAELEKQLGQHLNTKVSIVTDATGTRGKLSIEFYGLEHFDGLLAKLGFQMQ
jgi:ParB family transcriptional regulator, chromosome partitioning protein